MKLDLAELDPRLDVVGILRQQRLRNFVGLRQGSALVKTLLETQADHPPQLQVGIGRKFSSEPGRGLLTTPQCREAQRQECLSRPQRRVLLQRLLKCLDSLGVFVIRVVSQAQVGANVA